jgi:hypothetical protein
LPARALKAKTVSSRKIIISCAITGSIHTPSMSLHLPVTAAEIDVPTRQPPRRQHQ